MAKSKHTKHKKRPTVMPKRLILTDVKQEFGRYQLMMPKLMYVPDEYPSIPHSIIFQQLKTRYGEQLINTSRTKENEYAVIMRRCFESYMSLIDIDQMLNTFDDTSSFADTADIIDMSQYRPEGSDMLCDAVNVKKDIGLLWSPSEYACIKINDALEYRLKRLGYDEKTQTIAYDVCCYEKRILLTDEILTIPSVQAEIHVGLIDRDQAMRDNDKINDTQTMRNDLNRMMLAADQFESILTHDTNDTRNLLWYIQPTKMRYDSYSYGKKFITADFAQRSLSNDKDSQRIAMNMIRTLNCDTIFISADDIPDASDDIDGYGGYVFKAMHCILQKLMIPIASIIMTNVLLRRRRLSRKPLHEKKIIQHTPVFDSDAVQPEIIRTTRRLDSVIITSNRTPKASSPEKVIQYSKSQWSRNGFLRHYKSGKVVEIKPTTVHRKCVSVDNNAALHSKSTTYIVTNKPNTNTP